MKTTKEEILLTSLRLFADRGFDAVSTSMIAGELGITKGALYRHYKSKQEIFDSILQRMIDLDAERANEDQVPEKVFSEDAESYRNTDPAHFFEFVINQFDFWTGDAFASAFRRMITLEQFRNPKMTKLYQDVIGRGPVDYSEDLLREMIASGQMNEAAKNFGARNLAIQLFAPLQLMIQLADGGEDKDKLRSQLQEIVAEFAARWGR